MSRTQFIEYANAVSLRMAQNRARNFKVSEALIELWSFYYNKGE